MNKDAIVYIVDDDDSALWLTRRLLEGIDAQFRTYTSAEAFLRDYRESPCECLVCDLRMPALSGLEVQAQLLARGATMPIIFLSAHGEVSSAVEAIKHGAFDFLEKAVDGRPLIDIVRRALLACRARRDEQQDRRARQARLDLLTDREREVAELVAAGRTSREISDCMQISVRTVENHRAHLMHKLGLDSVAELVRLFVA